VAEFDPGFQRIEVHFVSVVRGGERIEHARPEAFQLLRRETNLERLIFDGRLTASLLIPDVRIGDVVETGVTVYGGAPVLGGLFTGWFAFDSSNPWFESRQRLLRPRSRRIFTKEFNNPPERHVAEDGEMEDSRWKVVGQQRSEPEALTPPWLILNPAVQFSEFESWNDVARLLAPFYEGDAFPEALAEEVNRLAAAHQDPAERAVEWLRFVQQELRYFAFSLGEGGLTPRKLEAIWSTRLAIARMRPHSMRLAHDSWAWIHVLRWSRPHTDSPSMMSYRVRASSIIASFACVWMGRTTGLIQPCRSSQAAFRTFSSRMPGGR